MVFGKHKEKLSSRLETNVEQEDTEGITTNVEKQKECKQM